MRSAHQPNDRANALDFKRQDIGLLRDILSEAANATGAIEMATLAYEYHLASALANDAVHQFFGAVFDVESADNTPAP